MPLEKLRGWQAEWAMKALLRRQMPYQTLAHLLSVGQLLLERPLAS